MLAKVRLPFVVVGGAPHDTTTQLGAAVHVPVAVQVLLADPVSVYPSAQA